MANKKKFVASEYTYSLNEQNNLSTNESVFDLSQLSLAELTKGISKAMNKGFRTFLFTQNRMNSKISLKIEEIRLLQTSLQEIMKLNTDIQNLKAEHFLNEETIKYIQLGKSLDLRHSIELKISQHKTAISKERIERERQEIELLNLKADIALKEANIASIQAKTDEQKEYSSFMKKVNEDFINLSNNAKILMFHDFINKDKDKENETDPRDIDFDEFYKEYLKKKYDEEVRKIKNENDFNQYKNDQKMKDEL